MTLTSVMKMGKISVILPLILLWCESGSVGVPFGEGELPHSAVLDTDEKFHVFWNFNEAEIVFEVQVQTLGYVGFGLSPNGDMTGSDIVIGGVSQDDGKVYFTDRHATRKGEPLVDESQDWNFIRGSQNDTHTILRFWRPLDTCDVNDRRIKTETARVIWAYNDEDADSEGHISYHGRLKGSKSILLLNPQKMIPEIPEDSVTVDFLNDKVQVPATDTTYWCQAFAIPTVDHKHHVIMFEPIIEPGHEWLVHHVILSACYDGTTNATAGQGASCDDRNMADEWKGCITMIFAWAVGGGPFYFPAHVGFPFGFEGDPNLVVLETHYDNPNMQAGVVDSSGLRLTLSPRPRKYDAGTLSTGVMVYKTHMIPPFMESFRSDGHCARECLNQAMVDHADGINIFAAFPHAHLLGVSIKTRHFRNGIEQDVIIEDDNYDFNFQETRMLEKEINVRPGDNLVTECYYRSTNKTKLTFGGISTREEMCLNAILFYPRIPLSSCSSSITDTVLEKFANITLYPNLTVKEPSDSSGLFYYDYMDQKVNWMNEGIRKRFQGYTTAPGTPLVPFCYEDRSNIYNVSYGIIEIPEIKKPLPAEIRCEFVTGGSTKLAIRPLTVVLLAAYLTMLV